MIHFPLLLAGLLAFSQADVIPCRIVKRVVAQYGEAAAEVWARAKGFSDKDIERARRCLRP